MIKYKLFSKPRQFINMIFILSVITSNLLVNCTEISLLKKPKQTAAVDSVLFYQQANVADPFIDSLLAQPQDSVCLKTVLLPPPPSPPPAFKQIEGFRVQTFAGSDSLHAAVIKSRLKNVVPDTAYLLRENGLFKVQIGNYPHRGPADSIKNYLRKNGYRGAWVVKRPIFIPNTLASDSSISSVNYKTPANRHLFRIQILATSDEAKALGLIQELQKAFTYQSYYLKKNALFKIYLGRFTSRSEAEQALKRVRKKGYQDAWLVY